MDIMKIADALYEAELKRAPIEPLTQVYPEITAQDAYRIQLALMERKMRAEGSRRVGMKIGLTGKAMQRLIGVTEPDFGHLTDQMLVQDGQPCKISGLIQPKVEGELAFCLKKELRGPNVTLKDVYDAVDYVVPAIEIVDSRIADWKIKLQDTIADNGSSARFVLGGRKTPIEEIDMKLVGMVLEKNGEALSSGAGVEVWGNPAAAVAWLANMLSSFSADMSLKAGEVILSGAVTAADAAKAGDTYTVSFDRMGSVCVRFE